MNRVDEGVLQVGWQISCRQEWQECEVAGTNRYKIATWKFYYCLKWSCYLRKIFVNPCEFLGLCWVVFRSRNFADAKRKEVVCITLGFFPNSASGNGIWALGSGISKKNGLGNGTGTPPSGPSWVGFSQHFFVGYVVPPGSPNSDPISDQKCISLVSTPVSRPGL